MGYTNKTSHYELPQYVANDKPSWLGDFNSAMLKIDTVLADNDATAEAANSAATGAQTQVASISAQIGTIQGQVNTAVDTATTADGKATTAQSVATTANTAAGEAKTLAEAAKSSADNALSAANAALPKSGGTMTGELVLNGDPTKPTGAATKQYVDSHGAVFTSHNFTPSENVIAGNAKVNVATCGNAIIGSGYGKTSGIPPVVSNVYQSLFNIDGNPFNLTSGGKISCGGCVVVGETTNTTKSATVVYDGTKTHLCIVAPTAAGTYEFAINIFAVR